MKLSNDFFVDQSFTLNNPNSDFTLHIDSTSSISINSIQYDPAHPRILNLQLSWAIEGWSTVNSSPTKIDVSYSGNQIYALDGTIQSTFSYEDVVNGLSCSYNLSLIHI